MQKNFTRTNVPLRNMLEAPNTLWTQPEKMHHDFVQSLNFWKILKLGGFLSPISTTKNANFGTKLGIPLKPLLVNPFWVSNPFWTLPEKNAPRFSENVNFGSILTKKGAKNGQKMKILKKTSEWAVICPLVTFCTHKKGCSCLHKPWSNVYKRTYVRTISHRIRLG